MSELRIGVLTCSDSRSAGEAEDTSGKGLVTLAQDRGWFVAAYHVVPDDQETIATAIVEMADVDEVDVILTTGGTGLGPRDVCPEATLSLCDREVPGIAEAIRAESMRITKRAMLSRGVAAMRGTTLIVNFPGSEKAARESFGIVADQLEHAAKMIAGGGHA
ncbi:MAG: molybdenum cofactor biosynthesis protein [Actinobacteria bacterium HGW-Actinobacteria-6]|nr:MAG: molybdenum cofactor biosynthesis protein [Actinobacteria bacterium HGW-Actinobacteria-6]